MLNKVTAANDQNIMIGSCIRRWRNLKGIKQRHLACMVNLSDSAISNMENDLTVPNLHQVQNIARCLDISLEMLLYGPEYVKR